MCIDNFAKLALVVVVVSCWFAQLAAAQNPQLSREREAVRRAQSALQKAEQEKAKLLEDKASLEKENAELAKKVKASTAAQRGLAAARKKTSEQALLIEELQRQLDAAKARLTQSNSNAEALSKRLAAAEEQGRQLEDRLRASDQQVAQQREIIGRQAQNALACNDNNAKLYAVSQELMARYQRKGVWDAILQREPVTGLKQVQIDNILQDYKDKIDALKLAEPELKQ